jgi:hypothetical protein
LIGRYIEIEISRALFIGIGIAKCTKRDLLFISNINININIRKTHTIEVIMVGLNICDILLFLN